jgi:hypothetical protein
MRTITGRDAAALLLAGLLASLAAGCGSLGGSEESAAAPAWINPDLGSLAEPVTLPATALPFTGLVTEGINYFRIVGLPAHTPQNVAVFGKRADADLFVLSDNTFSEFQCSSTRGGADDDVCATPPLQGSELFVEVYGFEGSETEFILDVW